MNVLTKTKTSWLNSSRDSLKYSASDSTGSRLGDYLLCIKGGTVL